MMGRPVWIAGSTHEGEEEMILQAHREIASRVSNVGLILAPRHPERLPRVGTMLSRDGLDWALLTEVDAGVRSPRDLILIDTMGELTALFGTADVVFLGGSLVPVGGHNILEPAAAGRVVVVGPHTWTVQDLVGEMIEQGAARRVADAAELSEVVIELLGDEEQRGRCGVEARRLCDGHRGAVGRTLDAIFESLGSD